MMKKTGLLIMSALLVASLLASCFPMPQVITTEKTAEIPADMVAKTVQYELTQISISTLVMQLTNAGSGSQMTPTLVTEAAPASSVTPAPVTASATMAPSQTPEPATATVAAPTSTPVPPTSTAIPQMTQTSVPSQSQATATRLSAAALTQTATMIPVVYITPISGYKTPVPGYRTAVPTVRYSTAVPYKSPTPNATPVVCLRARLVADVTVLTILS